METLKPYLGEQQLSPRRAGCSGFATFSHKTQCPAAEVQWGAAGNHGAYRTARNLRRSGSACQRERVTECSARERLGLTPAGAKHRQLPPAWLVAKDRAAGSASAGRLAAGGRAPTRPLPSRMETCWHVYLSDHQRETFTCLRRQQIIYRRPEMMHTRAANLTAEGNR